MKLTHIKVDDGIVFISVDMLLNMMSKMMDVRDQMVEEDPENQILVPGSDAAFGTLGQALVKMRQECIDQADLKDEVNQMLDGIEDYLNEQ